MNRAHEWRAFLVVVIASVLTFLIVNLVSLHSTPDTTGQSASSVQTPGGSAQTSSSVTQSLAQVDNDVAASTALMDQVDSDMQGPGGK